MKVTSVKIKLTVLFILTNLSLFGQSASEIFERIQKLKVTGTVLYVAAHPDDENTRLISCLSKEKKYRTGYISLTRGDGGQNLIGTELGVNLGLIRTRELMAAREIDGGEQFFTTAYDFGFSKNPDETFTIWNKDQVLEDLVYVIRKFRPDVIICRFPEDSRAGHGHHSASGILAREAFEISGDASKYTNQVQEFGVWQPQRLLWNTFNFGGNNTTSEDQFKLDVGGYNDVIGSSYGELAADSRSQHKSQGFGVPRQRGKQTEFFTTIKGTKPINDLLEGASSDWIKQKNGEKIQQLIDEILQEFKINEPSASIKKLIALKKLVSTTNDIHLKTRKIAEIDKLIIDCAGLWMACYSKEAHYATSDSMVVTLQTICRSNSKIQLTNLPNAVKDTLPDSTLIENKLASFVFSIIGSSKISQPYWLEEEHTRGMFVLNDNSQTGKPWSDYPVNYTVTFKLEDELLSVNLPIIYKHTDPVKGELYDPLTISAAVTATTDEPILLFKSLQPKKHVVRYSFWGNRPETFTIKNDYSQNKNYSISQTTNKLEFKKKGEEIEVVYTITPLNTKAENLVINYQVEDSKNNSLVVREMTKINYDHIPPIVWYPKLKTEVKYLEINIVTQKILYIKGAGDLIPQYLRQLGIAVEEVNAKEIAEIDLSNYKTIVTGIRAYNTDDRLPYVQAKLMNYVKNGGSYIVQYNTSAAALPKNIGPYPFTVGRGRVTEEDATITIKEENIPLLQKPNKITQEDFKGWIQERGLYFAEKADSNYVRPFLMNDKGEQPLDGSLIIAKYGAGTFTYTGLSFFREIPAGVNGAIRLFINLISENEQ
jgi:LmbE family N-acetylglucosaminyl deacetylase